MYMCTDIPIPVAYTFVVVVKASSFKSVELQYHQISRWLVGK